MSSWTAHLFVLVVAVLIYVAKWPLLILAAIVLFFAAYLNAVLWGAARYPRTTLILVAILNGMLGGRGRRRW